MNALVSTTCQRPGRPRSAVRTPPGSARSLATRTVPGDDRSASAPRTRTRRFGSRIIVGSNAGLKGRTGQGGTDNPQAVDPLCVRARSLANVGHRADRLRTHASGPTKAGDVCGGFVAAGSPTCEWLVAAPVVRECQTVRILGDVTRTMSRRSRPQRIPPSPLDSRQLPETQRL